jgi:DNA-directed RNA polymerase subunit RPC12/RpoP
MAEECSECGAMFASTQDLIQHSHEHSRVPEGNQGVEGLEPAEPQRGFMCLICGAKFGSPQALALHNLEPHTKGPTAPRPATAPPRSEESPPAR